MTALDEIKRAFNEGRADGLKAAAKQLRALATQHLEHARAIEPSLAATATIKERIAKEPLRTSMILDQWLEQARVLEAATTALKMAEVLERVSAKLESTS